MIAVQFGLVTSVGVFNPVFATERLERTAPDRVARMLAAWSVSSKAAVAATTAVWGLLAAATGPRAAIAAAGVLLLATPLLLLGARVRPARPSRRTGRSVTGGRGPSRPTRPGAPRGAGRAGPRAGLLRVATRAGVPGATARPRAAR